MGVDCKLIRDIIKENFENMEKHISIFAKNDYYLWDYAICELEILIEELKEKYKLSKEL